MIGELVLSCYIIVE